MPAPKRKRAGVFRVPKRPTKKPKTRPISNMVKNLVRRQLNYNSETKSSVFTSPDGVEVLHNNFITVDNRPLKTTTGVLDRMNSDQGNRVGDQIRIKGLSLKMMLELNERYSDVTFRLFVVRSSKGDSPTRDTLFTGISGNKMIDTLNSERYTIVFQKYIKMTAPNTAANTGLVGLNPGSTSVGTNQAFSRGTRIVKVWIPGKKICRNGKLQYENDAQQPKFFDYHVLLYAYSNISTAQDVWAVGRLNDYVCTLYFKDS